MALEFQQLYREFLLSIATFLKKMRDQFPSRTIVSSVNVLIYQMAAFQYLDKRYFDIFERILFSFTMIPALLEADLAPCDPMNSTWIKLCLGLFTTDDMVDETHVERFQTPTTLLSTAMVTEYLSNFRFNLANHISDRIQSIYDDGYYESFLTLMDRVGKLRFALIDRITDPTPTDPLCSQRSPLCFPDRGYLNLDNTMNDLYDIRASMHISLNIKDGYEAARLMKSLQDTVVQNYPVMPMAVRETLNELCWQAACIGDIMVKGECLTHWKSNSVDWTMITDLLKWKHFVCYELWKFGLTTKDENSLESIFLNKVLSELDDKLFKQAWEGICIGRFHVDDQSIIGVMKTQLMDSYYGDMIARTDKLLWQRMYCAGFERSLIHAHDPKHFLDDEQIKIDRQNLDQLEQEYLLAQQLLDIKRKQLTEMIELAIQQQYVTNGELKAQVASFKQLLLNRIPDVGFMTYGLPESQPMSVSVLTTKLKEFQLNVNKEIVSDAKYCHFDYICGNYLYELRNEARKCIEDAIKLLTESSDGQDLFVPSPVVREQFEIHQLMTTLYRQLMFQFRMVYINEFDPHKFIQASVEPYIAKWRGFVHEIALIYDQALFLAKYKPMDKSNRLQYQCAIHKCKLLHAYIGVRNHQLPVEYKLSTFQETEFTSIYDVLCQQRWQFADPFVSYIFKRLCSRIVVATINGGDIDSDLSDVLYWLERALHCHVMEIQAREYLAWDVDGVAGSFDFRNTYESVYDSMFKVKEQHFYEHLEQSANRIRDVMMQEEAAVIDLTVDGDVSPTTPATPLTPSTPESAPQPDKKDRSSFELVLQLDKVVDEVNTITRENADCILMELAQTVRDKAIQTIHRMKVY